MAKKILYVIGGLYVPTGMSIILSQKINYLAEHTNYELYMILTEKPEEPWYFEMNPRIQWINFDINFDDLDTMPFHKKLIHYLKKQHKYKKLFKKYLMTIHPDITISALRREINFINEIKDGSKKIGEIHFGRTFYRQFKHKYIPNFITSILSNWWMKGFIKNLQKLDKFVVLTDGDFRHWPELCNKVVIPNFISNFPTQQSSLNNKKVIAVGRYSWEKGFDMLIDAWSIVSKKNQEWSLHIYGPGDKDKYQDLAKQKGIEHGFFCHPAVKDIYEKYLDSSIFVLSSRYEGFGLVLVEAMSSGLPAVAFSCPFGPEDIVTDGVDGLLIEKENPEKLAEGLLYLMNNDNDRIKFGSNARKNMHRYDKHQVMQQWINLFESL